MGQQYELRLIGDYQFDEVTSSLQKMIRRGKEYEACYWAYILHHSGFGGYIWRRLSIIACEDIGYAMSYAPVVIDALASSWDRLHKNNKEVSLDKFLLVAHAVLFLCRAKKSRENDSLVNLIEENFKLGKRLEIPEVAIDPHSQRGRAIYGRFGNLNDDKEKLRLDKWFTEWASVKNEAYPDKYVNDLKKIWYDRTKHNTK